MGRKGWEGRICEARAATNAPSVTMKMIFFWEPAGTGGGGDGWGISALIFCLGFPDLRELGAVSLRSQNEGVASPWKVNPRHQVAFALHAAQHNARLSRRNDTRIPGPPNPTPGSKGAGQEAAVAPGTLMGSVASSSSSSRSSSEQPVGFMPEGRATILPRCLG